MEAKVTEASPEWGNVETHYHRYAEQCVAEGRTPQDFADWYVEARTAQVTQHNAELEKAAKSSRDGTLEIRPAYRVRYCGNRPYLEEMLHDADCRSFRVLIGGECYGHVYAIDVYAPDSVWSLELGLPGYEVEYRARFPDYDAAVRHIPKVIPVLVGVPRHEFCPHSDEAAREALDCAVDEIAPVEGEARALEFLRTWLAGDFSSIHQKWPDITLKVFGTYPDSIFGDDELRDCFMGKLPVGRPENAHD